MRVIYKYILPIGDIVRVQMPSGATPVRIDSIDGIPYIWAMVNPEEEMKWHEYHMFKTGGAMPDSIVEAKYVGQVAIFVQMELMLYVYQFPYNEFDNPSPVKMHSDVNNTPTNFSTETFENKWL